MVISEIKLILNLIYYWSLNLEIIKQIICFPLLNFHVAIVRIDNIIKHDFHVVNWLLMSCRFLGIIKVFTGLFPLPMYI